MKSNLFIKKSLLAKWKKYFKLNYNWESKFPAVIAGTYSLALLAEKIESGYFLAEQEIIINSYPSLEKDYSISSKIIAKKELSSLSFLKLESSLSFKDQTLIVLKTKLIKPKVSNLEFIKNTAKKEILKVEEKFNWRCFAKNQIKKFVDLSGDLNSIHLDKKPIVQGNLILLAFEDHLAQKKQFSQKIKIRFFKEIRADELIKLLKIKDNKFLGFVNDNLNFEIKIKEKKDV